MGAATRGAVSRASMIEERHRARTKNSTQTSTPARMRTSSASHRTVTMSLWNSPLSSGGGASIPRRTSRRLVTDGYQCQKRGAGGASTYRPRMQRAPSTSRRWLSLRSNSDEGRTPAGRFGERRRGD